MNEQGLNKKLAEWAGFEQANIKKHYYWEIGGERLAKWREPNTELHIKLPRFTLSLDACFKWLVPKLEPLGYDLEISNDLEMFGWSVCLHNTKSGCSIASPMEHYELNNIAPSLCKTIDKLISEKKDE